MMLHARKLTPERTAQAFPLVQLLHPRLSFDNWQRYADFRINGRSESGILLVEDDSGHIAGLFGYQVDPSLRYGRLLVVRDLLVLALFEYQRRQVLSIMLEALDRLASDLRCGAIHIIASPPANFPEPVENLAEIFIGAGHRSAPWGFAKELASAEASARSDIQP